MNTYISKILQTLALNQGPYKNVSNRAPEFHTPTLPQLLTENSSVFHWGPCYLLQA